MNPTSLNQLIIDREFGELDPRTAELLAAYLVLSPNSNVNPDALEAIAKIRSAFHVDASTASDAMPPLRLSPSAFRPNPAQSPSRRLLSTWPRHAAIAASLLLTFALGQRFGATHGTPSSDSLVQVDDREDSASIDAPTSFWSSNRFQSAVRARTAAHPASPGKTLFWTSPLTMPRLGA